MAETIPDIIVPDDVFINLNTSSGIAAGTAMEINNKSLTWVYLIESASQPAADSTAGNVLSNYSDSYARAVIPSGALAI